MSYTMAAKITHDRNTKGVERAKKANITDVNKAVALVEKYRGQLQADRSEKNEKLYHWSASVLLGARILSGEKIHFS
jgi:hypothetical protein